MNAVQLITFHAFIENIQKSLSQYTWDYLQVFKEMLESVKLTYDCDLEGGYLVLHLMECHSPKSEAPICNFYTN